MGDSAEQTDYNNNNNNKNIEKAQIKHGNSDNQHLVL